MKRIWGIRGDWYAVDYVLTGEYAMRYSKVKVTVEESIEAAVIAAVASELKVPVSRISVHQIVRMDS